VGEGVVWVQGGGGGGGTRLVLLHYINLWSETISLKAKFQFQFSRVGVNPMRCRVNPLGLTRVNPK